MSGAHDRTERMPMLRIRRQRWCVTAGLIAALCLGSATIEASPASRERVLAAYRFAYDLQFAAAYDALAQAEALDIADPAPPRARAALAWIETLFDQGVATFEAFSG